jgi:ribosomal protein L11 methyltransferase
MTGGHVEVEISADPTLSENLVAIFSQLGFEGFWEDVGILRCYISATRWSPAFQDEVRSVAALVARSSSSPLPRIRVTTIDRRNWNEEWEKTIRPVRVSDRLIIAPSWNPATPDGSGIVLTIDPKMSFGTGYHETTRLMLRLIEAFAAPGMRLLDVGTGTGILAIAGVKLGCAEAVGCDVDEWSFDNAAENAVRNGVAEQTRFIHGDISAAPAGPFDIVAANIQLSIILPIMGDLRARLAPGGFLLLSGLLTGDEETTVSALTDNGLSVMSRLHENEWIAVAASEKRPLLP